MYSLTIGELKIYNIVSSQKLETRDADGFNLTPLIAHLTELYPTVQIDDGVIFPGIKFPVPKNQEVLTNDYNPQEEYNPNLHRLHRFYRTGSFVVAGSASEEEMHFAHQMIIDIVSEVYGEASFTAGEIKPANFVVGGQIFLVTEGESEKSSIELYLNTLAVHWPNTMYDPDRFPGIIHRIRFQIPGNSQHIYKAVNVYGNGKFILPGIQSLEMGDLMLETFKREVEALAPYRPEMWRPALSEPEEIDEIIEELEEIFKV